MCLTTEMLAVFLNLLPADIVTSESDRITIHAEAGETVWTASGDVWCVDAVEASERAG